MVSNLEQYAGTNCKQSSNYFIVRGSIFMVSRNISYALKDYQEPTFYVMRHVSNAKNRC